MLIKIAYVAGKGTAFLIEFEIGNCTLDASLVTSQPLTPRVGLVGSDV